MSKYEVQMMAFCLMEPRTLEELAHEMGVDLVEIQIMIDKGELGRYIQYKMDDRHLGDSICELTTEGYYHAQDYLDAERRERVTTLLAKASVCIGGAALAWEIISTLLGLAQ